MPFVDDAPTRKLTNPNVADEWFEVRLLSWKELEECQRERDRKFMGRVREMGSDVIKAVAEIEESGDRDAEIEQAREQNRSLAAVEAFDRELLVTKSVTGWSYEDRFQSSRLAKLDLQTFTWLFEEIAALYVPSAEREEAEGKGDAGSSSTT